MGKKSFSIRERDWFQAQFSTSNMHLGWTQNTRLESGSAQTYHAHIFQAARDYYYGNRFGLTTPPRNGLFTPQMKIAAKQEPFFQRSHAATYYYIINTVSWTNPISLPAIFMRTFDQATNLTYGTTAHELAHFAHWNMARDAFNGLAVEAYTPFVGKESSERTIESWALGVEWQFVTHRYNNSINQPYIHKDNIQDRTITGSPIYTSLVVDMIDTSNQRSVNEIGFPQDRVENYTIKEVEDGLFFASSWVAWRENMRSRHNDPHGTEQFIHELFSNW